MGDVLVHYFCWIGMFLVLNFRLTFEHFPANLKNFYYFGSSRCQILVNTFRMLGNFQVQKYCSLFKNSIIIVQIELCTDLCTEIPKSSCV